MATRSVVTINRAGIEEILHGSGSGGHVHRYLERKGRETQRLARALAPKRTGALRASIHASSPQDSPRRVRIEVSVGVYYGIWQELGTGVYAGRGRIKSTTGKYLRFKPKNAFDTKGRIRLDRRGNRVGRRGGYIFAKSVKGTPAVHFLSRALEAVCGADPALKMKFVRK